MTTYTTAAASFVLPAGVSAAAILAAFGAFLGRGESAVVMPAVDAHTTDLAAGGVWFRGIAKRGTTGTSYVPQSRGSTG
jgi:hypothetical protein